MNVQLVTAPTKEPVNLGEAKSFCRVDIADDDDLLNGLVLAARSNIETWVRKKLVTQTWNLFLDAFTIPNGADAQYSPYSNMIEFPFGPIQSVVHLKYYDQNGVQQTMSSSKYRVDTAGDPGRLSLVQGEVWPVTEFKRINAVELQFTCGYGTPEQVPQGIKLAIKTMISLWYDQRTPIVDAKMEQMPLGLDHLLAPFKTWGFS